jgi:hypothetical protein
MWSSQVCYKLVLKIIYKFNDLFLLVKAKYSQIMKGQTIVTMQQRGSIPYDALTCSTDPQHICSKQAISIGKLRSKTVYLSMIVKIID